MGYKHKLIFVRYEIEPDYAEVHNNMGVALARSGKLEEAIAQYEKSLQIDPDSAEARNNLAVVQVRTGKLEEAIASFRKAVETCLKAS